jgi:hypothetical protein
MTAFVALNCIHPNCEHTARHGRYCARHAPVIETHEVDGGEALAAVRRGLSDERPGFRHAAVALHSVLLDTANLTTAHEKRALAEVAFRLALRAGWIAEGGDD